MKSFAVLIEIMMQAEQRGPPLKQEHGVLVRGGSVRETTDR